MATLKPKILISYGRINAPLRVPTQDLILNPLTESFLITNTASGLSLVQVKNIDRFNNAQILIIGKDGNQASEIIKTHATTNPSGSTVTLASALIQDHSAGSWVKVIPYDQLELSHAATTTGSKTVFLTTTISPGILETRYTDNTHTTGYYFARFKNSTTSEFSEYSDYAPYTGYTRLSARSVIDNALQMINKKTSDVLSDEFFFMNIDNCQMEVLREFKRWSFMQKFDQIVTKTTTGAWKMTLPTDVDDQNTNKSLYKFRIGKEPNMIWVDKEDWNNLIQSIAYSELSVAGTVGASTITLTSSSDFDASGSVKIRGYSTAYTANNETTGVLTLTSTLGTAYSAGVEVFQHESQGNPIYWTIYGGKIYHWPIISSVYAGRNYYLDYYKSLTLIDNDSDEIVLPDPTVVQYYLAWKALLKLSNGVQNEGTQGLYEQYVLRREKTKQKESLNREFYFIPDNNNYY